MGISDDIKPKRVYRFVQKNNSKPKITRDVLSNEETNVPIVKNKSLILDQTYEKKDRLEEEFFTNTENKTTKTKKGLKIPFRLISWILILLIIGTFVQKNLTKIKNVITGSSTSTVSDLTTSNDYYTGSPSNDSPSTESEIQSSPVATDQGQSSATVDSTKASIKIEILNGNGIKGSAESLKKNLVAEGFNILKVANAQKFSYSSTYIYYRTGAETSMELVKTALSDRDCITQLSDSITKGYDIVIVVGKN